MRTFKILLLLSLVSLAIGCAPEKTRSARPSGVTISGQKVRLPDVVEQVKTAWDLDKVSLSCSAEKCPMEVGILLFVWRTGKKGELATKRCTAFLTSSQEIMAAGHCDYLSKGEGFFITQPVQGTSIRRKVLGVNYKQMTPSKKADLHSGRPDYATFRLESPITEILPAVIARTGEAPALGWQAFVVNVIEDLNYRIDRLDCSYRRHESEFPFDLKEQPDMIVGYGCGSKAGNSGAPVYSATTAKVEGILAGGTGESMLMTNIRCIGFEKSCVVNDNKIKRERFTEMQANVFKSLSERSLANDQSYGLQFSGMFYELEVKKSETIYEVVHWPKCRERDKDLTTLPVPIEKLRVVFDEWGKIKMERLDLNESIGVVSDRQGTKFTIELEWFKGYGPLQSKAKHPREIGPRFSVDLPVCTK